MPKDDRRQGNRLQASAGGRKAFKPAATAAIGDDDIVVTRGRQLCGALSKRGDRWLAVDADGRKVGLFEDRATAFAAVLAAT